MIPWTLIIIGAICAVVGALVLLAIALVPLYDLFELVFDKDKDVVAAKLEPKVISLVREAKRKLTIISFSCCVIGIVMFYAGLYLGYAEKGENFWIYKKLFPDRVSVQTWDEINENGQFVTEDGKAFTYYILVTEENISLSGSPCTDLSDLKNRLLEIRRENTVIIIDSFAVSSTYHAVEKLLDELGIEYEESR